MKYYCTDTERIRRRMFDYLRLLPHASNQKVLKNKFNRDLVSILKKVDLPSKNTTSSLW